jgi:hypothetical protein
MCRRAAVASNSSNRRCATSGAASHIACSNTIAIAIGPVCRSNTRSVPTAAGSTTSATSAAGDTDESVIATTAMPASRIAARLSRG